MVYHNTAMTVYIENVIIDNFAITYLISRLSFRFGGVHSGQFRCEIASAAGTAVAVLYPFVKSQVLLILIKFGLYAVMCLILYLGKNNKTLPLYFLGITFIFGGIMVGIGFIVDSSVFAASRGIYEFSPAVIIGVIFIAYEIIGRFHVNKIKINDLNELTLPVKIEIFGKNYQIKGLLDTGNRAYDVKTGLPIILVNKLVFGSEISYFEGNFKKIKEYSGKTKISGIGKNNSVIPLFIPKSVTVYFGNSTRKFDQKILIGLVEFAILDGETEAILHSAVLKGGISQ